MGRVTALCLHTGRATLFCKLLRLPLNYTRRNRLRRGGVGLCFFALGVGLGTQVLRVECRCLVMFVPTIRRTKVLAMSKQLGVGGDFLAVDAFVHGRLLLGAGVWGYYST